MYTGRLVFSQLMEYFPLRAFRKCVQQYRGNYKVQHFSCLDQFLCMAFAQLTGRESLRDIETCLRAMQPKLYHAGFRGQVSRSTLADANEKRHWRIYLRRLRSSSHPPGSGVVRPRRLWSTTRRGRVCLRFQHRQSVSCSISVGPIPPAQSRDQAPHVVGSAWQYPLFYPHYSGKNE